MAKKPTIASISSGYQGTATLNDDLQDLRNAFDNTLSLDGSTPNAMEADLDLNSNDILNAGTINVTALVVGGISLTDQVTLAQDAADAAIAAASLAGTSSTTAQQAATDSINFANDITFTATTLSPGSSATTSYNSSTLTVTLGIPTGPTGPTGSAGTNGAKWYSGTGAPSGATGLVGDWYLDDAGGNVYEKTGTSTWTLRDNLTGPSGAGTGDMVKATYDTNNNGIVDSAETVPWTGVSSKPTTLAGYGITDISTFGLTLVDDLDAAAARTTLGLGTLATQSGTFSGTSSGTNTGDQNLFSTIAVSGQSNVVADTTSDTLTLVAGTNITLTTNSTTDTITIAANGTAGGMTLLGTLTTTSGTSQSLTSLTLTSYKQLCIVLQGVSHDNASASLLLGTSTADDIQFTDPEAAAGLFRGHIWVDLTAGTFSGITGLSATNALAANADTKSSVGDCPITTASTSVSVATSAGSFDAGTVSIYGVA